MQRYSSFPAPDMSFGFLNWFIGLKEVGRGIKFAFRSDSADWNNWMPISGEDFNELETEPINLASSNNVNTKYSIEKWWPHWDYESNTFVHPVVQNFNDVVLSTDSGNTYFKPNIYWNDTLVYGPSPLLPVESIGEGLEDAFAGGAPIVLAENASTAITTDDLAKIKDQSEILQIILPGGQLISIDPAAISENAKAVDLNIGLAISNSATTIHGVVIPINTIIITPTTHGDFGFTINIEISAEQLAAARLSGSDTRLFYINDSGDVKDYGILAMNADGSATVPISNASSYVLSDETLRSAPVEKPIPTDAEFLQERAAAIRKNGLSEAQLVLSANNKATLTLRIDGKEFVLATNVNNRNVSGRVVLPDGSGVLVFDIKGNGSNIKTFEVVGR